MDLIQNASIRTKLSIAFGVALALIIGVGVSSIVELKHVNDATKEIRSVWLPKIETLDDIKRTSAEHRVLANGHIQATNFRQVALLSKRLDQARARLESARQAFRNMNNSPGEQVLLAEFTRLWNDYEANFRTLIQRVESGETAAAQVEFAKRLPLFTDATEAQLDQLIQIAKSHMADAAARADEAYRLAIVFTIVAILIGIILSAGVIVWTSRNVTSPLTGISKAMRQLAVGDHFVTVTDDVARKDEIGVLLNAVAGYRESLIRSTRLALEVEAERGRLKAAVNNMPIGLCMFDADQRLIICNKEYADIYKLPADLLKGGALLRDILKHRLACEYNGPALERYVTNLLNGDLRDDLGRQIVELSDGRTLSIINQRLPGGGMVGTHEDITEMRQAEAQIRHMARHDALTDLPNRLLFKEQIDEALKRVPRGESLAVLCLDLDRFKSVNDTLGHAAGDELLRGVANRLRETLRENDIVARFGGDEFAIVQTGGTQPTEATALARRIIDVLSAPYKINDQEVAIGVSVGIAIAPADGESAEQLLKSSDMALYRAKSDGRGVYRFFEQEMDARMQARRLLELDLRRALIQREFELLYQPLLDIEKDEITGFEALLRWHHPQRGLVSPADFIPLAEETGLIVPIGEWVLRQACCEATSWPDHVSVAVNLSPVQFKSKKLVDTVVMALAESQLPSHRLELEITEGVLLVEQESTLMTLHQLRSLGVRIAMDDFGTGYSSLSYLRSFPFDKIKIDGSFISNLSNDSSSLAIIRAVTGLSTSLGMVTTAECVETEEQFQRLRSEGCNEIQGFLISKPRPVQEIAGLIAKHCKQRAAPVDAAFKLDQSLTSEALKIGEKKNAA
jgi:diguanylate cyclase (GGDEF)-like protein